MFNHTINTFLDSEIVEIFDVVSYILAKACSYVCQQVKFFNQLNYKTPGIVPVMKF